MKIFLYILSVLAIGIIVFNATLLDFDNLFAGDSAIALIGIAASLCAICVMLIFRSAKLIEQKTSKR